MHRKFNSIETSLRTTPYLFLKPNCTQTKPDLVNSFAIFFAGTELPLLRGKLNAYRIIPKSVKKQYPFSENLLKDKSLKPIL